MVRYKILGHTADVRLKVFGRTEEELFLNAAAGLNLILFGEKLKKSAGQAEKIEVSAKDINALLPGFLNEILARSQINRKIYWRVKFLRFSPVSLEAQIFGIPVPGFTRDVKAVTYHDIRIERNKKGNLEAELVLDV